ncbi:MAG: hypothetical protein HYX81_00515 [Chloroflexi bacterium]|nr:hypothetical protein [Chloroflexota bacterium]
MNHLVRAGGLLAAVLIFIFFGLRLIPVPAFLENYGFHKEKKVENAERWASLPISYAVSSSCQNCHMQEYTLWQREGHRSVGCENCHGPAEAHINEGKPVVVDTARELCATCHAKLAARPASFPQVDMKEMGNGADCVTCHSPHAPRAGMPPQVPHELEDRTSCQSCHVPHEPLDILPPKMPHTLEGRTDCLSCHGPSEVKGLTLPKIPHPLEGRTACLICHSSGGLKPVPADHAGRTNATCTNCHRSFSKQ